MDTTKAHYNFSKNLHLPTGNQARTISFISGQGGVGETTCALKFAEQLSGIGQKILLIDADFNLSNVAIKLSLDPQKSLLNFIHNFENIEKALHRGWPCDLIFGVNRSLGFYDFSSKDYQGLILRAMGHFRGLYDYIIVDGPAGCSREFLELSSFCDDRVVIVVPDKSSLTDSYSIIKLLESMCGVASSCLIFNKIQNLNQREKISYSLIEASKKFLDVDLSPLGDIAYLSSSIEKFDKNAFSGQDCPLKDGMKRILANFTEQRLGATPSTNDQGAF